MSWFKILMYSLSRFEKLASFLTFNSFNPMSRGTTENVLSFIANHELKAKYTGYSACPIPTQYGKLMLAEFDYTNTPTMSFPFNQAKPRWSMWIMKKNLLPWLYWNKILTGKA